MRKIINLALCVIFTAGAIDLLAIILSGDGRLWHGVLCAILACSAIAASEAYREARRY